MLESATHTVIQFLHEHPHWAQIITCLIAFTESLPIIGTIVPGSVTMTAIGVLVGTSVLPMAYTFFWATFGAFAGDCLGYWFGKTYHGDIRNMWPIKKYGHWLDAGENFFEKHGGKSVVIGRFVGPVRSMIPMIAGVLRMSTWRFVFAAIPSALLWAMVYMLPGVLLGALSLELPAKTATKFLLYALALILIIWSATVLIKLFFEQVWRIIDRNIAKLWQYLRTHRPYHWFTSTIADPREPDLHSQLTLTIFASIFLVLFFYSLWNIVDQGWLTQLNKPINYLMQSIRTPNRDMLMTAITIVAHKWSIVAINCIMIAWLIWQRHYRAAIHWLALFIIGFVSVWCIKHFYYSPRPIENILVPGLSKSSLPSGHTAFATMYFGFLAVLLKIDRKKYLYWAVTAAVILVALSRLYLNAHWLTDIISAILLGLTCLLFVTISYNRHHAPEIPARKLGLTAAIVIGLVWLSWSSYHLHHALEDYHVPHEILVMKSNNWWQKLNPDIPLYRNNRLGKPKEPLNIQWQGDLGKIKNELTKRGWQSHPTAATFKGALLRAMTQPKDQHLPILPQQFRNQPAVLVLTKGNKEKIVLVLRLWPIPAEVDNKPLWIGQIKHYTIPHKFLWKRDNIPNGNFPDVTSKLLPDIHNWQSVRITIPAKQLNQLPPELHWHGKVLQIR